MLGGDLFLLVIIAIVLYCYCKKDTNESFTKKITKGGWFYTSCGPGKIGDSCYSCGTFNTTDNCDKGLYCNTECAGANGPTGFGSSCVDKGGTLASYCRAPS